MEYVSVEQPEGCIFCTKPAAGDDEGNQILHRGDNIFVMMNSFPYNTGHLMVATFRHIGDPLDMMPEESSELMYGARIAVEVLRACFSPDGFNIGMNVGRVAGAGYAEHVHLHVVPRWNGDTNFMAVLADTRVVPEALADTFHRLKEALAERDRGEEQHE
jgi:ATP adenylyltransferase